MCGIIGYAGKDDAVEVLEYGLKTLEYRGYDSAGICIYDGEKFVTTKKAGTVDNLFKYINKIQKSDIGIGHTRWATHGKATDVNSHPHSGSFGKVTVVHNGIIENYKEIAKKHLAGITLKSETDTEVISNLIEKFYVLYGEKISAICCAIKEIKGSFALAIIFNDDSENIYFAKRFSPLNIGIGCDANFLSSDVLGFNKYTKKYLELPDDSVGKISRLKISVFDKEKNVLHLKEKTIPEDRLESGKCGYPNFMIKEINEIPKIIMDTASFYQKNRILQKVKQDFWSDIKRIKLIACGTSYHACLIGEKLLCDEGYDANAYIASEFIYANPILNKHTLCIFVSQSGETADTLSAIKIAREKGAKTLAITNVSTSTITKMCDYILPIKCGAEIAVASTKAYNGQLVAFFALTSFLSKETKVYRQTLKELKQVAKAIDIEDIELQIKPLIKAVINAKNVFMVGRQTDYVTSLESSLKLKEITYKNCQGYASGELKHGTISLIDNDSLVFAYITDKELASKTMNVIKQTQSRGAKICVISPFDEIINDETINYKIKLPKIKFTYYPIVSILPMQLISYYVSTTLGINPDKPRNLAKSVTVE